MRRLTNRTTLLAIAFALVGMGAVALAATAGHPARATARRPAARATATHLTPAHAATARHPFTLRGAHFSVIAHRLTYVVTICTPAKSVLAVRSTFAPVKRARGVKTLTPGATQYQDHGCWPAFVSAAIARSEPKHCQAISCPAIVRRRYRASVTVTFAHPRKTLRAPRLQAVA